MDNQKALQPIRLRKAKPQHGRAKCELELPPWMADIERRQKADWKNEEYKRWLKETYRRRRQAEMIEKVKVFVAGVAFVVFALATAVVR